MTNPSEEKTLIARAKRDPEAFGRLFDAHFDAIFNYTLHRVAHRAAAEDLTAQTFFKALRGLWRFQWSGVPLSAWLFRIATNEANGYLRRLRKRPLGDVESLGAGLIDEGCGPEQELVAAEEAKARASRFQVLHACVRELKPLDQALIVMRYFENKPFSEIALVLGKGEGALRMRNQRALEKLKNHLRKRGIRDEEFGRDPERSEEAPAQGRSFSTEAST